MTFWVRCCFRYIQISFENLGKSAMSGFPIVASVSIAMGVFVFVCCLFQSHKGKRANLLL